MVPVLAAAVAVGIEVHGRSWREVGAWSTPERQARIGSGEFLCWAGADHLVACLPGPTLTCFRLGREAPLWTREFPGTVEAVAANREMVFVMVSGRPGIDGTRLLTLARDSGETTRSLGEDQLSALLQVPFIIPSGLAWLDDPGVLAVVNSPGEEGANVFFLAPDLKTVRAKARAADYTAELSCSPGALTLCKMTNQAHVIDARSGRHLLHWGRGNTTSAIDATFLSNAHGHPDGTLVLVHDHGGWVPGEVTVHKDAEEITFGSENHHAVTDVDWDNRLIALSGTSRAVVLKSFEGETLATMKEACAERIQVVRFAPGGQQLAVLSQDGEVRVLRRPE